MWEYKLWVSTKGGGPRRNSFHETTLAGLLAELMLWKIEDELPISGVVSFTCAKSNRHHHPAALW